ncbi:MAG TPA: protein kinase [Pseudonocardia sp.]|nr:protein kinase [Pseudonocardia sp.]
MPPIGEESTLVLAQRYRLGERVGAGSMGAVWRATDELLGRTVAVKQLLLQPGAPGYDTQGQAYDEARQRILREGRLAARLQHPHAIAVFDVVLHDDAPWLVMEYLPSRTLGALLATEGPLDPRHVARIGRQIADGLSAAHAAGIVHRDIKPGNVLIGADGIVKITDFGVSRAADDVQLTRTGLIAGTPAYLAPETARGLNPTPASDVFALGSTLYTAVEGEPPFGLDDNAYALLYKVGAGAIRPPEHAGPLTEALLRMLRTDPAERPTATGARDELAAVAEGRQLPPPPSRSRRAPSVRRSGSSRRARRLAATRVDLDPVRPVDVAGPSPLAGPIPLVGPVLPAPLSTPQPTPLATPQPTQPLATPSGASDVTPSGAGRPGVGSSNADGSADGVARVDGSPDGVSGAAVSGVAGSDSVGSGDAGVDTAAWSVEGPDTAAWSATEGPDTAAWSATDTDGWGADRAGWPDERAGAGAAGGTGSDGAGIGSAGFGSAGFGSAGFGSAGFGSAAADADPPGSSAALLSGGQPATSALPAWQQPHRPRRWFDLRRRGPSLWALVALVVLVVAATATLAELRRDNSSGPTGGTSAAAPSTPPKAPASPVEIRPDGPPTAADLESFVRGYYALLPAQPAAAWQMLGDQARGESDGYQSYLNFYNGLDSVGFAEAPTAVDDRTVRATLRFATKGGAESVERYQFTVVLGPDGKLVMSSFTKG